jgi:tetratricopeptide (TPR) repeat protein
MKLRLGIKIAILFCLLAVLPAQSVAKDSWTSVRSKNFLLLGNASEKDIRTVGLRLEQFREVFSRLFTTLNVNSPIPTTVVVFKNDDSYRPFKLNQNTAGYFQPGPDVNYITLTLGKDLRSEQDPFTIIFHEYTHLLVRNTSDNVPTWFNEGLAEYYSTVNITGDQRVVLGRPIASHIYRLRDNHLLPLRTLFQVDQKSPYYNEGDKQSIFYAESWALLHYLMLGNNGQRMPQLGKFVELLSANAPVEQAFQRAFGMSFESMEKELAAYIQRDRYPVINSNLADKIGYDVAMESAPLSEAAAQAYLGDLLLHSNRAEAETYLQRALALDPDLALANASLGMLRVRQGRVGEALKSLERALQVSDQNYLIHYYYAYALSREGNRDMQLVLGFPPERAARMRQELKRAIQLRPDFPESYSLLAFVSLVTESEIDESLQLLKHALAVSPGRNDLAFMLAQIYVRKEDFATARKLIDKLLGGNDEELRQRARGLLLQLVSVEEQLARRRKEKEAPDARYLPDFRTDYDQQGQPVIIREVDPAAILRQSLRKPGSGERQAQGTLLRIECDQKGITFTVKINGSLLKLKTDSFSHVGLVSFTEKAGREVTCGARKPEDNVVVCYLPLQDARAKADGVARSIEFVPQDFQLAAPGAAASDRP